MVTKGFRLWAAVFILLVMAGCSSQPKSQEAVDSSSNITPNRNLPVSTCSSTDQDQYVYRPRRLQLLQPCAHAEGTVMEIASTPGSDGDIDFHLQLDAPYQALLTEGNQYLDGYLQVEAVCQNMPPAIEALRLCASDPDPFLGPFPQVGDHIWVEGRYVLDRGHHAWAELHPLYRWGLIKP